MFYNCISLKSINIEKSFNIPLGSTVNMSYMFYNCSSLTSIDISSFFELQPNDISYIFAYCSQLKELYFPLVGFYIKSMSNAFKNCTSLVSVKLDFASDSMEDMSYLFYGCISLTYIYIYPLIYYLGNKYLKYMNYMFYDCHLLKNIEVSEIKLNTTNLLDLSYMFSGCTSLISIDFSNFITKNVRNYEGIFYNCENLEYIDISSFTHNNLPVKNLSIFNYNFPSNGTIYINDDFCSQIEIPQTLVIEIINNE